MSDLKYTITICWSDEDEIYIAEVPELQSCYAFGQSYEEALEKVKKNIKEIIEFEKTKRTGKNRRRNDE